MLSPLCSSKPTEVWLCGSDLRDSDRTTYPSGWNLLKYWRAAWGRWQRGRCALLGFLGNKSRAWSQRELVLGVISVMETAASAEWASVITGCTGREKKWQLPRGMGPRGAGQLFKQHKVSVTVGLIGISLNISVIQPRAGSQMLADDFSVKYVLVMTVFTVRQTAPLGR